MRCTPARSASSANAGSSVSSVSVNVSPKDTAIRPSLQDVGHAGNPGLYSPVVGILVVVGLVEDVDVAGGFGALVPESMPDVRRDDDHARRWPAEPDHIRLIDG